MELLFWFKPYQVTNFGFNRYEPSGSVTAAATPGEVGSLRLTV
jgi:hypothetical protein